MADDQGLQPNERHSAMPEKPTWTDILTALSAVLSTLAIIFIAYISHGLQRDVRDLTFPPPTIDFQLLPQEIRRYYPENFSTNETGTIPLQVSGFSGQPIVIESIEVEHIFGVDSSRFFKPAVFLELPESEMIVVFPQSNGLIDEEMPINFQLLIRAQDESAWASVTPLKLGVLMTVCWFESRTHRHHKTRALSQVAFVIR